MSDDIKKENAVPAGEAKQQAPELSNEELDKTVGGAIDSYLQIDGIKGESQDDKHKDWIELA
jgi:hypothetical protein